MNHSKILKEWFGLPRVITIEEERENYYFRIKYEMTRIFGHPEINCFDVKIWDKETDEECTAPVWMTDEYIENLIFNHYEGR